MLESSASGMQTLGLSPSTPRSEGRLRALFWPTIRNETDFDYITQQGFWVCAGVAFLTLLVSGLTGLLALGAFEALFFFLAGMGVRERSRTAGLAAFAAYLLSALVMQRFHGNGFGVVRVILLALLLANIRGLWLSRRWEASAGLTAPPARLHDTIVHDTIADKLANSLPPLLWPRLRYLFYVLAFVEMAALLWSLVVPLPS